MATLLSKVRAITGSTTGITTDTQVVNFLQAGANFLVASTPPFMLWFLTEESPDITDGNGYIVQNTNTIFSVERDGKIADKVPLELANQVGYADSLFYATAFFPKYYIQGNKIYIKPDPNSAAPGKVIFIKPPKITSSTDSDNISYSAVENIIINYACALDFTAMANYYAKQYIDSLTDASSDAQAALDQAKDLIDSTTYTYDAKQWISEEDSEMASVLINAAQEEVNRAIAEMNGGKSFGEQADVYFKKAEMYFNLAKNELQQYIQANPDMLKLMIAQQQQGRQQ